MNERPETNMHPTPLLFAPAAEEASGELADLYANTRKLFGFLPNAARLYGVSPPLLAAQAHHIGFFIQHGTLGSALLAFIRMLVSENVHCDYCVDMNVALLLQAGVPLDEIRAAQADPAQAPLPEREKALLVFVLSAVADPKSVGEREISRVRAHGWSDREIFEAVYYGASALAADILLDAFKIPSDGA